MHFIIQFNLSTLVFVSLTLSIRTRSTIFSLPDKIYKTGSERKIVDEWARIKNIFEKRYM